VEFDHEISHFIINGKALVALHHFIFLLVPFLAAWRKLFAIYVVPLSSHKACNGEYWRRVAFLNGC
jgi:hypothetical protein